MVSALRICRGLPLVAALLFSLCAPGLTQQAPAQSSPPQASAGAPDSKLVDDLVAAYRILADHNLLDGWGHVSVRHDKDPNRYLMARGMSADMVTAKDIVEFDLDSRPVDTRGLPMSALFTERYIHGEIYKQRPDVIAVVHTHAPSLIPFGDTKVPLRPLYHRSAWIAFGVSPAPLASHRIPPRVRETRTPLGWCRTSVEYILVRSQEAQDNILGRIVRCNH